MFHDDWKEWLIQNQFWGLVGMGICILFLGAIDIAHEFKPPLPPYVFAVSKDGVPLARLQPVTGTAAIPDRATRYFLRQFVQNAFTIDSTFDAEKDITLPGTYLMMMHDSQASKFLTDFYKGGKGENNPIKQSSKVWQEAYTQPVIAVVGAPDTYEDYFTTRRHSYSDQGIVEKHWRIIMHVIVSGESGEGNDLGEYIDTLDLKEQP